MKYSEFLDTVKTMKMLYGRDIAETFFKKNIDKFYNLNSDDLNNLLANDETSEYDEGNASLNIQTQKV